MKSKHTSEEAATELSDQALLDVFGGADPHIHAGTQSGSLVPSAVLTGAAYPTGTIPGSAASVHSDRFDGHEAGAHVFGPGHDPGGPAAQPISIGPGGGAASAVHAAAAAIQGVASHAASSVPHVIGTHVTISSPISHGIASHGPGAIGGHVPSSVLVGNSSSHASSSHAPSSVFVSGGSHASSSHVPSSVVVGAGSHASSSHAPSSVFVNGGSHASSSHVPSSVVVGHGSHASSSHVPSSVFVSGSSHASHVPSSVIVGSSSHSHSHVGSSVHAVGMPVTVAHGHPARPVTTDPNDPNGDGHHCIADHLHEAHERFEAGAKELHDNFHQMVEGAAGMVHTALNMVPNHGPIGTGIHMLHEQFHKNHPKKP